MNGRQTITNSLLATNCKSQIEPIVNEDLSIEKSDLVYDGIKKYLYERGLSPSALNVYLSNPMDFLLYHVLGLREKENVDSAIEPSTLGTVVHDSLEKLMIPYLGMSSDKLPKVGELMKKVPGLIKDELSEIYPKEYFKSGRLKILVPVLEKWIYTFLVNDLKRAGKPHFQ